MRQSNALWTVGRVTGVFLLACTVWAQQGAQAPPSGGGAVSSPSPSTPTTSPRPSPIPSVRPTQPPITDQENRSSPAAALERPIFLSGKVALEDGTPPPESVVIQRVCNGVVRPEGYTDSKGRFSFQLGRNSLSMFDASVGSDASLGDPRGGSSGISERDLATCDIRAYLSGYRSDQVMLSGRRFLDNPNIGTIFLHRYANVEGTTISLTSLQAPKDAKKAFEKGRSAINKKKWEEARQQLEKAVGIYPQYAAAWCDLGRVREQAGDIAGARKAYATALSTDAKFVSPYIQLVGIAIKEQNWQEVVDASDRVVRLDPVDFPGMYYFNSVANYSLKQYAAAEKSAREGLELDTQRRFPQINHLLGIILARKGDFVAAAQYMKTYLQLAPQASNADVVKRQLVEIEKSTQAGIGNAP
jgi:tetratricopeptide (TPR) repeat protein